jgi:hypothetical protein
MAFMKSYIYNYQIEKELYPKDKPNIIIKIYFTHLSS